MRHDSVELLLHNTIRDGIGLAYRQQHGLPDADRTIPASTFGELSSDRILAYAMRDV